MLTLSSSAEEGWTDINAYWELRHQCLPGDLLLRKAGQTPSSSTEESWTDGNAYWEASLLRKAGQMQCILGSSSSEEGWTDTKFFD